MSTDASTAQISTASTSQSSLTSPSQHNYSNSTIRPTILVTSSTAVLTPTDIKICSLDQLANPPVGQQPNYPWWTIIRAAIMGSQYGILNREEIYRALENRWQYFRTTDHQTTRVWKSAVGHNLSVKECFVRVHVEGGRNVSYYIVDTAVDPAKGRLSKTKNANGSDRMPIPTISRKVVIPPGFDLSIRARWSPAIAAIRNAKYGIPCNCSKSTQVRQLTSSNVSEGNSHTEDSSESDEDVTETGGGSIYPTGSRLGSSLIAIIHPNSPRRLRSIPRLAFSRSLSNALVSSTTSHSSRRRNLNSCNRATTAGRQAPVIRPPISRSPDVNQTTRPAIQPCNSPQQDSVVPFQPGHSSTSHSPPEISSLQEQVDAALADVAAKLPEIADQPEEPNNFNMMFDMDSSILDALPELDIDAIFKEAQAFEVQGENQDRGHNDDNRQDADQCVAEEDFSSSLVPTTADFDRLLASVIPEFQLSTDSDPHVDETRTDQEQNFQDCNPPAVEEETEAENAGLDDLLQHLIDEATNTGAHQINLQDTQAEESDDRQNQSYIGLDQEENQNDDSTEAFMEASRILEKEIEEAIKLAEEQEMLRAQAAMMEQEKEESRRMMQVSSSANPVQLTPSGDIPVHPLPPVEPTMLPSDHQPVIPVLPARRAKPKSATRTHAASKDKQIKAVELSTSSSPQQQQLNKRSTFRPSLLSCLPNPITLSSSSSLVDRRTRASGARAIGRRLNLPLPSSHTTPRQHFVDSSLGGVDGAVDGVDDGSSLAPQFLEAIETVTLNRPNSTFPELAKEALLAHPDGKLTAAEIFKVLEKKYPYFLTAPDSWKATLRNVLTSHSCFVKIPRPIDAPGRGDWWSTVDLPLWKRRRTTAKAKQDEDFIGRYAREQMRKTHKINNNIHNPINNNNLNNNNLNNNNRNSSSTSSSNNINRNLSNCNNVDESLAQVNNLIHC